MAALYPQMMPENGKNKMQELHFKPIDGDKTTYNKTKIKQDFSNRYYTNELW